MHWQEYAVAMASNKAHHASGWAAGVIAAALVAKAGMHGPYYIWSLLSLLGGAAGGTAPDWLEVAWWSRKRRLWITHRTLTHWGIGWVALVVYTYRSLALHPLYAIGFGFALGAVVHLLADWPNPLGVPWILGRHSLKLWNSGRFDTVVVGLAWAAAFVVSDHVWFHDVHNLYFLHFVRAPEAGA